MDPRIKDMLQERLEAEKRGERRTKERGTDVEAQRVKSADGSKRNCVWTDVEAEEKAHKFWGSQPVVQFDADRTDLQEGPLDPTLSQVRDEPYALPESFEWYSCDLDDQEECKEVYDLLTNNYVEDSDAMFRFDYSPEFLRWALHVPGYTKDWHLAVRVKTPTGNGKMVGFISAVPQTVRINGNSMPMVEINFLCVHKKLRSKRLAPVLIKEITRRAKIRNVFQAVYTAGVVLPGYVGICRYYHRQINCQKLIDIGFSRLPPKTTLAKQIKTHRLPGKQHLGMRQMTKEDVPQLTAILATKLAQYKLAPVFTESDVGHLFLPVDGVIECYVKETNGKITDMFSYYNLPSTVLYNSEHSSLKAAYSYYNVANTVPLYDLFREALVVARDQGYDVFNALDLMENEEIFEDLKFGIGDGHLQYYVYNWKVQNVLKPKELGLVLL